MPAAFYSNLSWKEFFALRNTFGEFPQEGLTFGSSLIPIYQAMGMTSSRDMWRWATELLSGQRLWPQHPTHVGMGTKHEDPYEEEFV